MRKLTQQVAEFDGLLLKPGRPVPSHGGHACRRCGAHSLGSSCRMYGAWPRQKGASSQS